MPNHFHFLVFFPQESDTEQFSQGMRIILGSYVTAINRCYGRTGSLFTQNTHSKPLEQSDQHYPQLCFYYIHHNPLRAKLVSQPEDGPYSSLPDYLGIRRGTFCNQTLARQLLDLPSDPHQLAQEARTQLDPEITDKLF